MGRYLIFAWCKDQQRGGANDIITSAETLVDAYAAARSQVWERGMDVAQIYDSVLDVITNQFFL